jgi:glutathione S-transferase
LLGNTLTEKAIINKWVEVEGQNFSPPATAIVLEYVNSSTSKWPLNEELIATQVEKLKKELDMYDSHLSKNRYLVAGHYSLVDLFHTALLMQIKHLRGSL